MAQLRAKGVLIGLQETHSLREVHAPGFHQLISSHRKHKKRGVAILLSKKLFDAPTLVSRDRQGSEVWAIARWKPSNTDWLVGSLHLKGTSTKRQEADARAIARFLENLNPPRPTIVMGDFNLHPNPREVELITRHHRLDGREGGGGVLSTMLRNAGLILKTGAQIEFTHAYCKANKRWDRAKRKAESKRPTRGNGKGWIDFILISADAERLCRGMKIDDQIIWSDHLPIFAQISFGAGPNGEVPWKKISPTLILERSGEIAKGLKDIAVALTPSDNLADLLAASSPAIESAIGKPLWSREPRAPRRHGWWFAGNLQRQWRFTRKLQRSWRYAVAHAELAASVIDLRNRWRMAKDVLHLAIAKEREKCWLSLMSEMEAARIRDPRRFGQIIRSLTGRGRPRTIPSAQDPVTKLWSLGKEATNRIREVLVRSTSIDQGFWTEERIRSFNSRTREVWDSLPASSILDEDMNAPITEGEVVIAVKAGRTGSSPGLSGWTTPIWRVAIAQEDWRKHFVRLLNAAIASNILPSHWNHVRLIAIPKAGVLSPTLSDWRGVSLLDLGYKILAKILERRLAAARTKYKKVRAAQFGFEAGRSTSLAYLTLAEIFDRRADRGLATWVAFLDVSKAFDSVSPWVLRLAMASSGLGKTFQDLVCSLYFPTTILDFDPTVRLFADCGVRQGCPLAPALFNLVIDMLAEHLDTLPKLHFPDTNIGINQVWYADDCALIAGSQHDLQILVGETGSWLAGHGMKLNVKKCKVLSNLREKSSIHWGSAPLERVRSFFYLGLPFTDEDPREKVISTRFSAVLAANSTLSKHIMHNKSLNIGLKASAARPLIEGTLFFGCELWSGNKEMLDKVDRFTSQLCRRMLRLNFDGGAWAGAIAELGFRIPSLESKRRAFLLVWRLFNDARLAPTPLARLLKLVWNARPPTPLDLRETDSSWLSRTLTWLRSSRFLNLLKAPFVEAKQRLQVAADDAIRSGAFLIGPQPVGKAKCANLDHQKRYFSSLRPMPKEIALHPPALAAGVSAWCGLGVGSFRFSCRWNWIFGNKTSDYTCCACRCSNEDTEHLLWYCKAWKRHRRHFVAHLDLLVGGSKWEAMQDDGCLGRLVRPHKQSGPCLRHRDCPLPQQGV